MASALLTGGLATGASALGELPTPYTTPLQKSATGVLPTPYGQPHSAPIDLSVYAPRAV